MERLAVDGQQQTAAAVCCAVAQLVEGAAAEGRDTERDARDLPAGGSTTVSGRGGFRDEGTSDLRARPFDFPIPASRSYPRTSQHVRQ